MKLRMLSFDYTLISVSFILSIFGLLMVYSASIYSTIERYEKQSSYFFSRHALFLVLGFFVFIFAANFNYKLFKNTYLQIILVVGSILLLIYVESFGKNVGYAQRWIEIGPLNFQPTEVSKLVVVLYMSSVFHKKQKYIDQMNRSLVPPFVVLLLIVFLVNRQPDLGNAILILGIGFCIIITSGMNWRNCSLIILLSSVISVASIWFVIKFPDVLLSESKVNRILGFLDPFATGKKEGYQLINSYFALGSGKFTGVGFGNSIQKYGYLPESHTDAIIAIIGEEFGFLGVMFVLVCLSIIVIKGILIGRKCKDPFGRMIAIGISSMIGLQSFINLGGMVGFMPITGITLPFVSYGGTSMLLLFFSLGLVVNISMQTERSLLLEEQNIYIYKVDKTQNTL